MRRPSLPVTALAIILGFLTSPVGAKAAGRTSGSDWAQVGFDASHASLNPTETILSPSTVAGLTLKWQTPLKPYAEAPIVADGLVFATSTVDGTLRAMDSISGAVLWSFRVGRNHLLWPVAVANGIVYVSFSDVPTLYALNETDGTIVFQVRKGVGSSTAPTVVTDGSETTVYIALGDTFYAIDGTSGGVLWSHQPTPFFTISAAAAVVGGIAYLPDPCGGVHAYDRATGAELWSVSLWTGCSFVGNATIDGGRLFVARDEDRLWALDTASGTVLWKRRIYPASDPSAANGIVYLQTRSGTDPYFLTALEEATGAQLWKASLGNPGLLGFTEGPAIANGVVYVGSSAGAVDAYDATAGARLWDYRTVASTVGAPAVVDGRLFVTVNNAAMAFGL